MSSHDPPETEAGFDSESAADDGGGETDVRRRWLVRLLVGLGIGIPVVVEGATFAQLVGDRLFGGGDDGASGPGPTPTRTRTVDRIGVGDELLPGTAPTDTLTEAVIRADGWILALTVTVENTTEEGYGLRLGAVHTDAGQTIEGGTSTGRIPPGETRTITGEWDLPSSATPTAIECIALTLPADGTTTATTERVSLARVPVQG